MPAVAGSALGAAPPAPVLRPRVSVERRNEAWTGWMMLLPYLAAFAAFMVLPSLYPLALGVALNARVPMRAFLRGAFFLPFTLSVSIVSICWWWLLDANFGPVYVYLKSAGIHPPVWLSSPGLAMAAVVLATVWWTSGYNMVLFLAGLQDIPQHLYEAARMDGAGGWLVFRAITLPLLRPTMLFVVVIQLIASFQVFGQVYVMTNGGPGDSTRTVIQHVYETAFVQQRMAEGSAAAWILFVIILAVSVGQFHFLRGHTEY
jgi:multiple sugar transport system permease protein